MIHHVLWFLWHKRGIIGHHKAHNNHHSALSLTAAESGPNWLQIKNNLLLGLVPGVLLCPGRLHSILLPGRTAKWSSIQAPRAAPAGTTVGGPRAAVLRQETAAHPQEMRAALLHQNIHESLLPSDNFFLASKGMGVLWFNLTLSPAPLNTVPARQLHTGYSTPVYIQAHKGIDNVPSFGAYCR